MKTNKFILKDYHAVEEAEILLNGITVLAGINGCGKSTIARWLYGFIHYSNEYDKLIDLDTAIAIYKHTTELVDIQRRLAFLAKQHQLPRPLYFTEDAEKESMIFQERLNELMQAILRLPDGEEKERSLDFTYNALNITEDREKCTDEKIESIRIAEEKFLTDQLTKAEERKQQSAIPVLYSMIEKGLGSENKGPGKMQFSENGTDLLDHEFEVKKWKRLVDDKGHYLVTADGKYLIADGITGRFIAPMSIKRAIYIDSPMAISNANFGSLEMWNRLREMLVTPLKPASNKALPIINEIRLVLGGEIVVKEELSSKELRFIRKADGLNITIDEIATGMKSFAYILRLLQNGYIDSETLLIIDEPEVHLHPQWVVKFAKVLVLLHKYLDCKIMLASHSPDMVAAINTVATAEGVGDATNFYQATKLPGSLRYKFEGAGNDISNVFDCFNVALERIDAYKSVDNL